MRDWEVIWVEEPDRNLEHLAGHGLTSEVANYEAAVFRSICAAGEIQVVDATLDDASIAHKVIHCLHQYDCIDNSRSAMTKHGPRLVPIEERIGSAAVFSMENGTEFVAVREDLADAVNNAVQTEVGFARLKVLSGGSASAVVPKPD
jgi:hypothetical protein